MGYCNLVGKIKYIIFNKNINSFSFQKNVMSPSFSQPLLLWLLKHTKLSKQSLPSFTATKHHHRHGFTVVNLPLSSPFILTISLSSQAQPIGVEPMTTIIGNDAQQQSHHWWPPIFLLSLSIYIYIFFFLSDCSLFCFCFFFFFFLDIYQQFTLWLSKRNNI